MDLFSDDMTLIPFSYHWNIKKQIQHHWSVNLNKRVNHFPPTTHVRNFKLNIYTAKFVLLYFAHFIFPPIRVGQIILFIIFLYTDCHILTGSKVRMEKTKRPKKMGIFLACTWQYLFHWCNLFPRLFNLCKTC